MSSVGYAADAAQARTPTLFGRVMGLVALTVGFATRVYICVATGGGRGSSR